MGCPIARRLKVELLMDQGTYDPIIYNGMITSLLFWGTLTMWLFSLYAEMYIHTFIP